MDAFTEKYTDSYFLGGKDSDTGHRYGLSGYKEFNQNKVHERFSAFQAFIESLTDDLAGKNILEIGFGRGELIPFFLKKKCHLYHGIDVSHAALKIAKERFSEPNVTLKVMDANNLDKEEAYDVIVMNHLIEQIPVYEMQNVWGNVKKALRPGGYLIIGTTLFDHPNEADPSENIHEIMGLNCHKQTKGTLLRTCLEQHFILGGINQSAVGFIKRKDLLLFPPMKRDAFLTVHDHHFSQEGINRDTLHSSKELRKLVPQAGRLLIGCVTENNAKYYERTLRLVQSIRWFGGKAAGTNIIVCFVDDANPSYVKELHKWGVFVRIVERFSQAHPPSNKLRFFELPEVDFYDTVMFLDCDTVLIQDPTPYIDGHHFQAKIANGPSVPHPVFKKLFKHYQLPLPNQDYLTSNKSLKTIWYCNTGVLIFPIPLLKAFFPVWKSYTADLVNKRKLMQKSHAFCEQASLSLAFVKNPVPFKRLTNQMNCPSRESELDPVILHYRNAVKDNGELKIRKSTGRFVAKRIMEFNERTQLYHEGKERS